MKVWFIGEAPTPAIPPQVGAPLAGECGRRLQQWSGLSVEEFRARTVARVLFPTLRTRWHHRDAQQRWDNGIRAALATAAVNDRDQPGRLLAIAVGTRVRDAVAGLSDYPPFTVVRDMLWDVAWIPTPMVVTKGTVMQAFLQRIFKEAEMGQTYTKPMQSTVKKPMGPKTRPAPKKPSAGRRG